MAEVGEHELAQEILDSSPTFVVAIDAGGRTVYMNGTMLGALGYTRGEVIGQDYATMFVPVRDHEMLRQVFEELLKSRGTTSNENRILTRSGRELLVEWHGRPIFDDDGTFRYFYGFGIDVTWQKRMREALSRSQQRLAHHFQQSPLGMIEWDADFRVLDWNPAAEAIFGWSRDEAVGQHGQELVVPPEVRPYVADIWEQIKQARGAVHALNQNVTKDGRTVMCEWTNTAILDEDGEVVAVASLVSDVTDRMKEEEAIRVREREQAATIEQLSAPVLDLWEGVLAMPVVGGIDAARATKMTENLLDAIVRSGARFAILDLTGASTMDASIASHLGDMIRATRLVGSECLVSGLGPGMARTLVDLDVPLSVKTFGSLRAALRHALRAARV
jgi:rsbT co-antagonist protein RsbR